MRKTIKRELYRIGMCAGLAVFLLCGCGSEQKTSVNQETEKIENDKTDITGESEQYAKAVTDIVIPDQVSIIGLGEATHGNRELQTLKREVFEVLVNTTDCRVFALEADFGGAYRVNEYIHGGEGTAEEAASELGFGLYRTDEMADLIEWCHAYNESVDEKEQVSFYGFDMQRYDNNKQILLDYLEQVDSEKAEQLAAQFSELTDETVYTQSKEINKKAAEDMNAFLEQMSEARQEYVSKSDVKSFELAYACGECIMQNATIQSGSVGYNVARDQYMAAKVEKIMEIEQANKIMIAAHNGHIQKKSPNPSYVCMGEQLAEKFGTAYFAIGTDFIEGEVNVIGNSGEQENVAFKGTNKLKNMIKDLEGNAFYFDVEESLKNEELAEIMQKPIRIFSIGNEFNSLQKIIKFSYTSNDILAETYDGIVIFKNVTPTVRKPLQ